MSIMLNYKLYQRPSEKTYTLYTDDISADTATDSTHTAPEYSDQSILCVCMYKYACLYSTVPV